MEILTSIESCRRWVEHWNDKGDRIALVPTMGNLHQGHLSLVQEAKILAQRVVVSIFVNPTQFGPNEDFSNYPRTIEQDMAKLRDVEVDAVFMPDEGQMYGSDSVTWVEVEGLSKELCGAHRPEHFRGVTTVVAKLFQILQPQVAVFGRKDLQQLKLIEQMTHDLFIPVEIYGIETVRQEDGLALSSRNQYLSVKQQRQASQLIRQLILACIRLDNGDSIAAVEDQGRLALEEEGFAVDYLSVRRSRDLGIPGPGDADYVVLVAARLGKTRLIDNISLIEARQMPLYAEMDKAGTMSL